MCRDAGLKNFGGELMLTLEVSRGPRSIYPMSSIRPALTKFQGHHPHRRAPAPEVRPDRLERQSPPARKLPPPHPTLERLSPAPPARRCVCPSRQGLRRHQPTRIRRLHGPSPHPIAGKSSPSSKSAMPSAPASGSTMIPAGAPTCANLPRFKERGWTVAQSLRHAWPDLTSLLLYAVGLFVLANRLFARYDAK